MSNGIETSSAIKDLEVQLNRVMDDKEVNFLEKDKKVTDSSEKISNEVVMTQYNKSIFKKIWNKILSIFQDG